MHECGPARAALLLAAASLFALPQPSSAQLWEKDPVMLSGGNAIESYPVVAWGDHGFGVVWFRGDNEIRYTLLDENCVQSKQPTTIYSTHSEFDDKKASITYKDDLFYIVFLQYAEDGRQVFLQRVHYNYDPFGAAKQLTSGSGTRAFPKLVWNGTEFGLLYIRIYPGTTGRELYFQRYDGSFNEIGAPKLIAWNPNNLYFCDLVWTGKYWGVAWVHEDSVIHFQRLKIDGNTKGPRKTVFTSTNSQFPKDIDLEPGDRGGFALAFSWKKGENDPSQIYVQLLRKNGKNMGRLRQASDSTIGARNPTITWDKLQKHFGVFWSDGRDKGIAPSYGIGIYASLLTKKGVPYEQDYQLTWTQADDREAMIVNNGDVALLVFTAYQGLDVDVFATRLICESW
jgi:hypothetical protein